MTKIKEKNKNDEKELCEKLIDLLIIYQIEDSYRLIELISHRIKFYDIYIQHLFATKPFFFQKKKMEQFNKDLESLENKKMDLYKQIGEEVDMIAKLHKSLRRNETLDVENIIFQEKINYYNLVEMIKSEVQPNKVCLSIFGDERTYIYKKGSYILEDEESKNDKFDIFLDSSLTDESKLEKNIKILQ